MALWTWISQKRPTTDPKATASVTPSANNSGDSANSGTTASHTAPSHLSRSETPTSSKAPPSIAKFGLTLS